MRQHIEDNLTRIGRGHFLAAEVQLSLVVERDVLKVLDQTALWLVQGHDIHVQATQRRVNVDLFCFSVIVNRALQVLHVRLNVTGHQVERLTRRQHDEIVNIVVARCPDDHLACIHQSILQTLQRATFVLEHANQVLSTPVGYLLLDGFLDTVVLSSLLADLFCEARFNLSRSFRLARRSLDPLLVNKASESISVKLISQRRSIYVFSQSRRSNSYIR